MENDMGTMLADPLPQVAEGFAILNADIGKGQAKLLADSAPIHIDHFCPSAGVDVLTTIGPNPVHGTVSVTEDHRLQLGFLVEDSSGKVLQIRKHILSFLPQDVQSHAQARTAPGARNEAGFDEIIGRQESKPDSKPRVEKKTQKQEKPNRANLINVVPFPLQPIDDLEDIKAAPGKI